MQFSRVEAALQGQTLGPQWQYFITTLSDRLSAWIRILFGVGGRSLLHRQLETDCSRKDLNVAEVTREFADCSQPRLEIVTILNKLLAMNGRWYWRHPMCAWRIFPKFATVRSICHFRHSGIQDSTTFSDPQRDRVDLHRSRTQRFLTYLFTAAAPLNHMFRLIYSQRVKGSAEMQMEDLGRSGEFHDIQIEKSVRRWEILSQNE
jgi:hypothetical protein